MKISITDTDSHKWCCIDTKAETWKYQELNDVKTYIEGSFFTMDGDFLVNGDVKKKCVYDFDGLHCLPELVVKTLALFYVVDL